MAKKKVKPAFRHEVQYEYRGQTRFGVVSMDKAKPGNVIVDDAVLPFRVEVPDDDKVIDIESSLSSKTEFPVYDRMTGLLTSGGNAADKWINAEKVKAEALSAAAGKGVVVNKLFSIGVADGHAVYVVTAVKGSKVDVEWRGFGGGDRYTDHFFGYGKKNVSKADVAKYIRGEEGMAAFFKKTDDRDRDVIESRPLGAIIHYVEGRAKDFPQFIRYQIVMNHDGSKKVAQLVGFCGTFPDWKKPHITDYGTPHIDHDFAYKLANPIVEKLCASYVYETATGDTPDLKRSVLPNPATLPLLDLTMPEPTAEQLLCKRVNETLQAVRDATNGKDDQTDKFNSVIAMRRLAKAYKVIRAELMLWTVDDFAHNGIKDQTLSEQATR